MLLSVLAESLPSYLPATAMGKKAALLVGTGKAKLRKSGRWFLCCLCAVCRGFRGSFTLSQTPEKVLQLCWGGCAHEFCVALCSLWLTHTYTRSGDAASWCMQEKGIVKTTREPQKSDKFLVLLLGERERLYETTAAAAAAAATTGKKVQTSCGKC